MSAERFELSTNGLKGRCSAIELRARAPKGKARGILTWEIVTVNVKCVFTAKGAKFAKKTFLESLRS